MGISLHFANKYFFYVNYIYMYVCVPLYNHINYYIRTIKHVFIFNYCCV